LELADLVRSQSGETQGADEELLQAIVPLRNLAALAANPDVRYVRLPLQPLAQEILSEGRASLGPEPWDQLGIRGRGAKVGIVDLGFAGADTLVARELPGYVTARSFRDDQDLSGAGNDHGTAVAEIVHDMAPDAQLYLVRIGNEVDLGNAVDYLISQGVRVANHSVGWFQTGGGDGTGTVADIIGRARDAGILWVNSGGNYAQRYWEGPWSDGNSNNWLDFASADETDDFTLGPNGCITAYLSWNNWPVTNQDYDLYLFGAGNLSVPLAASVGDQTGSQSPTETLDFCSTTGGSYTLAIRRFSASPPTKFRLFTLGVTPQYRTTSGSLASPADSPKAFAVGAMAYNAETLESFSSQGPTQDGRIKPDITGPDGVSTATYGTGGFFGTSAAAPHVAGAAALVAGRFPARTAANLQANLTGAAQDYGSQGGDNLYGAGMLRMPDDMIVAGPPIRLAFTISPQNTLAGVPLSKQPAVVVQDANGFVVTTATNPITVTLTSGASIAGGSVSCPVNPVTPSDGTAVFSGCVVEAEGVGITLTASSPGLASAVSEPFRVTPPSGLINPTVTLSDAAPGRTGVTVTTTFTISTAIKADTDVVVIFPTGFGIASARAVNTPNSGTMVGLTGVNVSEPLKDSQGLRARRLPQLGALPVAAGVRVRLNIENVTNPSGSGLAGPFVICTREGSFGDAIACMTSIAGDESILDSGVAWDVVISPAAGVPAKLALSLPNGAVPSVLWE
ncbi:MAG: S8 family serine peptidase, partial [Chloroflexi bacterium]|nr:S8 family serine peptidase [Chloroflexota bacterium]